MIFSTFQGRNKREKTRLPFSLLSGKFSRFHSNKPQGVPTVPLKLLTVLAKNSSLSLTYELFHGKCGSMWMEHLTARIFDRSKNRPEACFSKVPRSFRAQKGQSSNCKLNNVFWVRIAKFDSLELRRREDVNGIVTLEIGLKSFRTFEKQAPEFTV